MQSLGGILFDPQTGEAVVDSAANRIAHYLAVLGA